MRDVRILILLFLALPLTGLQAQKVYHSNGGEIIFSGADVNFNGQSVNTNIRFTMFFHTQHLVNLDLGDHIGLYTGFGIRNVGMITEDLFQNVGFINVDNTHPDYGKSVKLKRRCYSLGFPLALKLGSFGKHFFIFGGYEYEWMFHYKQKLFIDGGKIKETEWTSNRVNSWIPSVFAGIQFPQGVRLKVRYYLEDFLNPGFAGTDFNKYPVDYSQFGSSGMWYISVAFFFNRNQIMEMISGSGDRSAQL